MRAEVDRHVVEEEAHVRPVVGVEAAQEVLGRLAAALMLTDHEAGHHAQDVGGPALRTKLEVLAGDNLLGGGVRGRRRRHHYRLEDGLGNG